MRFQLLFCRVQRFPRGEQNRLIFHLPLLLLRQSSKGSLRLLNGTFAVERYRAERANLRLQLQNRRAL